MFEMKAKELMEDRVYIPLLLSFALKWTKKWKSQPTISDFPQIS